MRAVTKAEDELRVALAAQLEPRGTPCGTRDRRAPGRPAAASDQLRWQVDRGRFTDFMTGIEEGAPPQPKRPSAFAAARVWRISIRASRATTDAGRRRPAGAGALPGRRRGVRGPGHLRGRRAAGDQGQARLAASARRAAHRGRGDPAARRQAGQSRAGHQTVRLRAVRPARRADTRSNRAAERHGTRRRPPRRAPCRWSARRRCYATFLAEQRGTRPELPDADQTPWTHGGPPWPHVRRAEDQAEEWR